MSRLLIALNLLVALTLLLSGCAMKPRQGEPAPVVSRDGTVSQTPRREGEVEITPLPAPPPTTSRAEPNRAVELLQQRAQAQVNDGDFTAAAKTLERALSIQPDNARTWNLLAHLRAGQRQYAMAAEIAAKSNSMAGANDTALKQDNWRLIAEMRMQLGDSAGASRARQQAANIN